MWSDPSQQGPDLVFALLQRDARAFGIGQGRAATTSRPTIRDHRRHTNLVRFASSICTDVIFGKDRWKCALYAAKSYAAAHELKPGLRNFSNVDIITWTEEFAHFRGGPWFAEHARNATVALQANSRRIHYGACKAGLGLAILPCLSADRDPDLVRLLPPEQVFVAELYLVTHRDLARTARVRAVILPPGHLRLHPMTPIVGTSACVKVFGCRPPDGRARRRAGAGVRKPPREGTAGMISPMKSSLTSRKLTAKGRAPMIEAEAEPEPVAELAGPPAGATQEGDQ